MTSDNGSKELFKRQNYGRQSLDGSKMSMEQRRQICRLRKSEIASKSEENLTDSNHKINQTNENIIKCSQFRNSFENIDNMKRFVPQSCDTFSHTKSDSCDNMNRERTCIKAVSYPGPPPAVDQHSEIANYHSYIPVSVDITTERSAPNIQKTALTMEPVTPGHHLHPNKALRPFTSVNFILRPPSSEPQSPIDIVMHGSSITYSTFSNDPKLGYESQLEINFRPAGPTSQVASRLKSLSLSNENANPSTQLVISEQIKRKQMLEEVLESDVERLQNLEEEINRLKKYLFLRQSIPKKLVQVKEDIIFLRGECAKWTSQVDLASNEQVPLGETNEDYYKEIYHESDSSLVWRNQNVSAQSHNSEEVGWQCNMCTFINYPALPKCEQCEMPRLDFESSIIASSSTHPHQSHTPVMKSNVISSKCFL
ncbi:unnamed protein product [Bemisia tabaci]|uniref:RanBP2-type domain-containing protein n=1 Tax=Bemisia tabaci TaxID=7038 RepID=A0A9P0AEW6_BEMTA|nr:unnamed protein product [Bemisia tabaci]